MTAARTAGQEGRRGAVGICFLGVNRPLRFQSARLLAATDSREEIIMLLLYEQKCILKQHAGVSIRVCLRGRPSVSETTVRTAERY